MIIKHQLRWSGHCVRMSNERLPKKVLYSQLSQGHRTRGGQRKRYEDTLMASLQKCGINTASWEELTRDRASWRQLLHRGTASFEINRLAQATAKQQLRKERERERHFHGPTLPIITTCDICLRVCGSRIGLLSHRRSHLRQQLPQP